MFSRILDKHRRQYQGMAFQTSAHLIADRQAAAEAVRTLQGFFTGEERKPAVEDALCCLVMLYGEDMKGPCRAFWTALRMEDEAAREVVAQEAHQLIERQLRSRPGVFQAITGWEHHDQGNPFA